VTGGFPDIDWFDADDDVESDADDDEGVDDPSLGGSDTACDADAEAGERVCDSPCSVEARRRVAAEAVRTRGVVCPVRARVIRRRGFSDIDWSNGDEEMTVCCPPVSLSQSTSLMSFFSVISEALLFVPSVFGSSLRQEKAGVVQSER
jgi:hypothetical protein